ncbi:unnamed protein product [Protopolystoma xenopodis]|uniref:Uncharacterized protein n=1 Tax=Protopolystoma xenopodis TaxID=117903 RepID=A0A448WJK9_9PLAT|nr:unnamed protein product [Protopolystoma xenopodis]
MSSDINSIFAEISFISKEHVIQFVTKPTLEVSQLLVADRLVLLFVRNPAVAGGKRKLESIRPPTMRNDPTLAILCGKRSPPPIDAGTKTCLKLGLQVRDCKRKTKWANRVLLLTLAASLKTRQQGLFRSVGFISFSVFFHKLTRLS